MGLRMEKSEYRFIMLCALEDTLTVSLSSQVYKWVTVNLMIGGGGYPMGSRYTRSHY